VGSLRNGPPLRVVCFEESGTTVAIGQMSFTALMIPLCFPFTPYKPDLFTYIGLTNSLTITPKSSHSLNKLKMPKNSLKRRKRAENTIQILIRGKELRINKKSPN
jgi:hypothetical protein